MISTSDLLDNYFLEHPFLLRDTRFFTRTSGTAQSDGGCWRFHLDEKDPSKNLGIMAPPAVEACRRWLSEVAFTREDNGQTLGLYLNTNTLTEPRHFLMAVLETLRLSRSIPTVLF